MNKYLLNFFLDFRSLIRLARPMMSNSFSVMFDRPNRLAPVYITWLVTYKCNCRCLHCSNRYDSDWANNEDIAKELKKDEILKVAHQIGRSKIWGVSLSGGEPLVRDDIFEVIKILRKYNKVVNLSTNGEFLKKYADQIIDLGVNTISISFDSHKPEVHDHLRSNVGLFEKAVAGIEELKNKRKRSGPKIKVRCTISRKNFLDMEEYIKFWQNKVDQVVFQPIQNTFIHQVQNNELLFNKDDYQKLDQMIKDLIKKYSFMNNLYYKYIPLFLLDPQKLVEKKIFRCFFRSNFNLSIDPYGVVQPCHGVRSQVIGNVKEEDIIDLWKKQQTFEFQRALRAKKCNCICWEDGNFFNLYLVRLFNLTEKLLFWKNFPEQGVRVEQEIENEPNRYK